MCCSLNRSLRNSTVADSCRLEDQIRFSLHVQDGLVDVVEDYLETNKKAHVHAYGVCRYFQIHVHIYHLSMHTYIYSRGCAHGRAAQVEPPSAEPR